MDLQQNLNSPSSTVSFADVAHQTLIFDVNEPAERLVLELLDTRWMQRLRSISQTGNTRLVYMFAEHSRFGHSLGVAYLALLLMKNLKKRSSTQVGPYEQAVAAAALLHDIGHVAPGSHLGERVWAPNADEHHESVSMRAISGDSELRKVLDRHSPQLAEQVCKILADDDSMPSWTRSIISGGGWNADRGNWAIVDSAMCSVSYGRYNVAALIDAFCLSPNGDLVLQEARLDALTHFFVARDSMYRQVYQHRVLQATDMLSQNIIARARDLLDERREGNEPLTDVVARVFPQLGIFCDQTMAQALCSSMYARELSLETLFGMTEPWWEYHLNQWCSANDPVLRDLCLRLRDRRLLKTIRLERGGNAADKLIADATEIAVQLGFDPRYYVAVVGEKDRHRLKTEDPPMVLLDSGKIVPVTAIEPLIEQLMTRPINPRSWLAVPKEIKEKLGRSR